jgi:hypothetical protein
MTSEEIIREIVLQAKNQPYGRENGWIAVRLPSVSAHHLSLHIKEAGKRGLLDVTDLTNHDSQFDEWAIRDITALGLRFVENAGSPKPAKPTRMSRETKFGYGFLCIGWAVPYLLDQFAGHVTVIIAAIACGTVGIGLLVSGHLQERTNPKLIRILVAAALAGIMSATTYFVVRQRPAESTSQTQGVQKTDAGLSPNNQKTFNARMEVILDREAGLFFWTVNGKFVCPAPVAMFLDITNLQSSAAMISKLTIEAMDVNGSWARLPQLPTSAGIGLYVQNIPPPNNASEVKMDRLDQLISNHNFGPSETVRGWAFFDNPFPSRFSVVRISIVDLAGNTYTSAPLTAQASSAQDRTLEGAGRRRNLTLLKVQDHCGY